ncbi:MAG: hypothetical protein M1398_08675, partial [Deltaproteobacteria bacterium]|nr:hypothetical protein [Deltaproteobacteria bacterium]
MHNAWFMDGLHVPDSADYVSGSWVADVVPHGFCWAAEKLSLPNCKGIIWRDYKHLRFIITPIVVDSENEVREREVRFEENILRLVKEFGPMWEQYKTELLELYRPFKEYDLNKATALDLAQKIEQLRGVGRRMCEIHFWGMYASFSFFMLFREFWKALGFDPSEQEFSMMLRGFDNKSFQCERELWRLSRRVLDLDLVSVFKLPAHEVAPVLQTNGKGKQWFEEFDSFLDEYGWRCEKCWFPSSPSWRDDPKYAIRKVQDYLKLSGRNPIMQEASQERDASIEKVLPKIPEDKRGAFNLLLKGAQFADAFSEEHDLYCEMQTDALRRLYLLELGRRFVDAGSIDKVDDIFLVGAEEAHKMAYWPEKWRLQHLIKKRRAKASQDLEDGVPVIVSKKMSTEEAFGYMMKSRDPIIIQVIVGEMPEPKPELKADLVGVAGAPGVAEGPARVVLTDEQVNDVLPGEIMVCPTTTISWTTAFSLVKGLVVDRGGGCFPMRPSFRASLGCPVCSIHSPGRPRLKRVKESEWTARR